MVFPPHSHVLTLPCLFGVRGVATAADLSIFEQLSCELIKKGVHLGCVGQIIFLEWALVLTLNSRER